MILSRLSTIRHEQFNLEISVGAFRHSGYLSIQCIWKRVNSSGCCRIVVNAHIIVQKRNAAAEIVNCPFNLQLVAAILNRNGDVVFTRLQS
ncbi:hypothetical protein D3C75_1053120 [compost metagenome]